MEPTDVTPELVVRAISEVVVLLLVLVLLLTATDLRRVLQPVGAGAMIALLAFLGAWGVVQATDRWQYSYPLRWSPIPLTRFAMYQAHLPGSTDESYAWTAVGSDGSEIPVSVAEEFATISLSSLSTRMRVLLESVQGDGALTPADAEAELTLWASGLASALHARGVDPVVLRFARVVGDPRDPDLTPLLSWRVDSGEVTG